MDKFILVRLSVDLSSARTLLLQADQLQKYKQRIEAQRSRIDGLSDRFYFLRNSLGVISLLMIGFIALSIYAFYKPEDEAGGIRKVNFLERGDERGRWQNPPLRMSPTRYVRP